MTDVFAKIRRGVDRYYTAKLVQHGATPQGVDWNSAESQEIRFRQLASVIDASRPYSVLDYGCGYGALFDFLTERGDRFTYVGFDLSAPMVEEARLRIDSADAELNSDPDALTPADYTVASGIFNVKLDTSNDQWTEYVVTTLAHLASLCRRGFAFNMLTTYSDDEYMRDDLYYGDPAFFFDLCKRRYSRHVALLHDYDLYEFTIRVRLEDR